MVSFFRRGQLLLPLYFSVGCCVAIPVYYRIACDAGFKLAALMELGVEGLGGDVASFISNHC